MRYEKIAIIGSGVAGLSAAYELVKRGYMVTVFEVLPEPGGMLRVGIPSWKLPKDVLETDIEYLKKMGIEIRTGVVVGKDITIDELLKEGYKAVLIATGCHKGKELRIEGGKLEGVIHAINFTL
jgi:NADPH-dependent glutamate synthase beta subunit-like oxidoreductase